MFSLRNFVFSTCLWVAVGSVGNYVFAGPVQYEGIGRTATPMEVKAWDIDVRPDFKGLPKGSGSVAQGQDIWETKCASCHGTFGESGSVFFPLIGNTTHKDAETGHIATLQLGSNVTSRTMIMKLSTVSTLWDYINRAMPWTAPKSLKPDEVYAVTAYLLNLGNVLPDNFVMSDKNIAEVQKMIPNRNGMTTKHFLWPGKEFGGTSKPDVQGSSCMKNCLVDPKVGSFLPNYAMNTNGNLAEQNREIGAVRGINTDIPMYGGAAIKASSVIAPAAASGAKALHAIKTDEIMPLLQKNNCTACHAVGTKVLGPAFKDVAKKYDGRSDGVSYLMGKIKSGGGGLWGAVPMPPSGASDADAKKIAEWLSQGSVD